MPSSLAHSLQRRSSVPWSLLNDNADETVREIAFWVFTAVVLVVPVALIGLFEGAYNHALKNALYFAGASSTLMNRLFPPPTYELPNDVFFEATGVMQAVLGGITAWFALSPGMVAFRPHSCCTQGRIVGQTHSGTRLAE